MIKVLITGVTGSVGSEFLRYLSELLDQPHFILCIRPTYWHSAQERLNKLLEHWQKFDLIDSRLAKYIAHHSTLVETSDWQNMVDQDIDYIFHCAADTRFDQPLDEIRKVNVELSKNIVELAKKQKSLKRFLYVSTAFVNSKAKGLIDENMTPKAWQNTYEQSKYEAEQHIVQSLSHKYTIVRPSVVIGESKSGYIYKFKVLYVLFRVLIARKIPRIPFRSSAWVDIVPMDYVIESAIKFTFMPAAENQVIHICAGTQKIKAKSILDQVVQTFRLPQPRLVGFWVVYFLDLFFVRWFVPKVLQDTITRLKDHLVYMDHRKFEFDLKKYHQLADNQIHFQWHSDQMIKKMVEFCRLSSWGKRKLNCAPSRVHKETHSHLMGSKN